MCLIHTPTSLPCMANEKATASSGAAQPAALPDSDSTVAKPAAILCEANNGKGVSSLHLGELNTRSAKLGCWGVGISNHGLINGHGKIRPLSKRNRALLSAAYWFQVSSPVSMQWLNKTCAALTKTLSSKLSNTAMGEPC